MRHTNLLLMALLFSAAALNCARAEVVKNDDVPPKNSDPLKPERGGTENKTQNSTPTEIDEPGFKARISTQATEEPSETKATAPQHKKIVKSIWSLPQEEGLDPSTLPDDAPRSDAKEEITPLLAKALSREKPNSKPKDLIAIFQEVVTAEPSNALAHYKLGVTLHRNGEILAALNELEKALKLQPNNLKFQCDLGLMALHAGDTDRAFSLCQSAAVNAPSNARYQSALGDCLIAMNQTAEAVDAYKRAIAIDPNNPEYLHNMGVAYQRAKQFKIAIDVFSEAIKLKPGCATYYCSRGMAHESNKSIRPALADYLTALKYDKNNAHAHFLVATLYSDPDDPTFTSAFEAIEHATKAVQLTQGRNAQYLMGLARAFRAGHRYDNAVDAARQAVAIDGREEYKRELAQFEKLNSQGLR